MAALQDSSKAERPRGWLSGQAAKPQPFSGARKGIRVARWVLMAVVLAFGGYALTTYSTYTIPGKYVKNELGPLSPDVEKGDSLLLQNLNFGRTPKLYDIVVYRQPGKPAGEPADLIGRIMGVAGEKLERVGPTMKIGGREPLSIGFDIGPGVKLKDGDVVPADYFLVLVQTDSDYYPDSRTVGFVPRENVTQRMAMNLATLWGRAEPAK
ncbi:MAG: hypothetical protein IT462_09165 [Planctomycetes bacterium]|nr:hypothetical protein [Planctomycetota bacterium]